MSINVRLIFALSIILGLMASQMLITINLVSRVADISTDVSSTHLERIHLGNQILGSLLNIQALLTNGDEGSDGQLKEELNRLDILVHGYLERHQEGGPNLDAFTQHYKHFSDSFHGISVMDQGKTSQLRELLSATMTVLAKDFQDASAAAESSNQVATYTRSLLSVALIIATVVEIFLGWYLARYINTGLKVLLAATHKVAQGDLSQSVVWEYPDEFGHLARSFNAMIQSLKNARLENSRLHREALKMQEERIKLLRQHLSRTVKAQEDERKRVARELHDQAGQALTALKLGLGRLEKMVSKSDNRIREEIISMRDLAVSTMEDIRNLALDLRPSMLDELGLIPAVRQYAKDFSRRTGLSIDLSLPESFDRLPSDLETAVFRVIQEALTNVAKHAQASQVKISISFSKEGLSVLVADNGCGFDVTTALRNRKSLGLFGIQERVDLLGGSVRIESAQGEGTRITVWVPVEAIPHIS